MERSTVAAAKTRAEDAVNEKESLVATYVLILYTC